jgi:hypothetical protein
MFKSIRFRFLFWYTLILAVTLSVFDLALNFNVSATLKDQMDDLLLAKAEGIAGSINTYWETEKMDALKHGAKRNVFSKINNANFLKIARRWVDERSNDPDLMNILVQIYKPNGELIAFSRNALTHLSISKNSLHGLATNRMAYEDLQVAREGRNPLTCASFRSLSSKKGRWHISSRSPAHWTPSGRHSRASSSSSFSCCP